MRYEIIEQLFPDWNKASERTRDAEISPSLKDRRFRRWIPVGRVEIWDSTVLSGYQGQSKGQGHPGSAPSTDPFRPFPAICCGSIVQQL